MSAAERRAQVRRRLFWKGLALLAALVVVVTVAVAFAGYSIWSLFEALP